MNFKNKALQLAIQNYIAPEDWNYTDGIKEHHVYIPGDYNLVAALSSNIGLLKQSLEFLFPSRFGPLYVCSGFFGSFITGAALQYGISSIVCIGGTTPNEPTLPPPGYIGKFSPTATEVAIVQGVLGAEVDPLHVWKMATLFLGIKDVTNFKKSVRCILDVRQPNLSVPTLEDRLVPVASLMGYDDLPIKNPAKSSE